MFCKAGNKHIECKSCSQFTAIVSRLEEACKDFAVAQSDNKFEYQHEFFRGAVIQVITVWEAYVYDILKEGFNVIMEMENDLDGLAERWPKCQTAIQNSLRRRQKSDGKKNLKHHWKELHLRF